MSNKTISIAQENKLFDGIDVSSYQGTIDFNRVKASLGSMSFISKRGRPLRSPIHILNKTT